MVGNAKLGETDLPNISPKTPSPQYFFLSIERKKSNVINKCIHTYEATVTSIGYPSWGYRCFWRLEYSVTALQSCSGSAVAQCLSRLV